MIADALRNDQTLFTSWDEIEVSWRFVDSISESWRKEKPNLPNYKPGSYGQEESDILLRENNNFWWSL
jgi:glucose-6-phosphate 1-dehydrogenase